jgi:phi13 family phage major tail protein
MKFEEYRGVEGLVIAELTETVNQDGSITGTYGTPERLSGVQELSGEVEESTETHYYDNVPAIVVDSEGADTYTLTVSVPEKRTRALIEGTKYDETTGALIGTPKEKKYFALGFIAEKTSGVKEYNWVYKGKFSGGGKTNSTKTDGTDATNMEYTYTSIHTNEVFEKTGGKPCKYLSVEADGAADLSNFFASVTKPDALMAVA